MFKKTYHATHPDMMAGASNQQLRDRYLVEDLFAADAITLNYAHYERFVIGGAMAATRAVRLPDQSEPASAAGIAFAVGSGFVAVAVRVGAPAWVIRSAPVRMAGADDRPVGLSGRC